MSLEIGYEKPYERLIYDVSKSSASRLMSDQIFGNINLLSRGVHVPVELKVGSKVLIGNRSSTLEGYEKDKRYEVENGEVFFVGESSTGDYSTKDNKMLSSGKMLQPFDVLNNTYYKDVADSNLLYQIGIRMGIYGENPNTPLGE